MPETTLQAGMEWAAKRAQQLSQEWGAQLTPLGWERNIRDLTAGRHRLVARLNNAHTVVAFDDATLVDLPRNVLRQVAVDARLRVFLHEQLRDTAPLIA